MLGPSIGFSFNYLEGTLDVEVEGEVSFGLICVNDFLDGLRSVFFVGDRPVLKAHMDVSVHPVLLVYR